MTLWKWSQTPANNMTADPTVNYRENQAPSSLNDSARAAMAATAKFRDDITGALSMSGTSSAYSLTTNQNYNPAGGGTLTDGLTIAARPNVTNAAGATLNVDSTANIPLRTVSGQPIPAGYLIAGSPYRFYYNLANNEWIVFGALGNPYGIPLGGILDFSGSSPPNSNFALAYGQAISRTTYAALFALIGSTFGSGNGIDTFNLPDLRGRAVFGKDDMGGSAAGRLTTAGSSIDGTTLGAAGGAQNVTLARSALPNVQLAFTGNAVNDHAHSVQEPYVANGNIQFSGGSAILVGLLWKYPFRPGKPRNVVVGRRPHAIGHHRKHERQRRADGRQQNAAGHRLQQADPGPMMENVPTIEEVAGVTQALQVIAFTALGLYLANSRADPDLSKSVALLEDLKLSIRATAALNASPLVAAAAVAHGDQMLTLLIERIADFRGEVRRLNS